MKRVALLLAYEGTHFVGYQVQPNRRTVQGELEQALQRLHKGHNVRVYSSGRTDTGVHARAQVVHFDTALTLEDWQWPKALNSCLPDDVRILEAAHVHSDFHARFDCRKRQYRYRVLRSKQPDVFRRQLVYHVPYSLSVESMQRAATHLTGTHDFTSFCSADSSVEDKVRTLYEATITEDGDELIFLLTGSGFLHNMVRIIVGTLLEVGAGKRSPDEMATIIAAKDRKAAGKTAPGHGLFLWGVSYENSPFTSFQ